MSPTEVTLLAVYRTPIIRLERICQEYFGVSYDTARKLAALNRLPVPAYRMGDSMKAPFVVGSKDLAAFIDSASDEPRKSWERSQV